MYYFVDVIIFVQFIRPINGGEIMDFIILNLSTPW